MNRNYRIEEFYGVVNKITNKIPAVGLGADLIAGFPSETDKDFEETMSVVKNTPFSYLHVFNFSGRKITAAYDLPGQVPSMVRKKRVSLLNDLGRKKSLVFKNIFLGKLLNVLVENKRDAVNNMLKGYSDNYLPVHFIGPDKLMNQLVNIRLSHIENDTLYGFPFRESDYYPGEGKIKDISF
jgi:threonylcarbamoyladenosine tRNA methylthiotransferase MtaB